ncbi:MAG: ABC transporter permease [Lysinibacillus sp.]
MKNMFFSRHFEKSASKKGSFLALLLLGFPIHLFTLLFYWFKRNDLPYKQAYEQKVNILRSSSDVEAWARDFRRQEQAKAQFFNQSVKEAELEATVVELTNDRLHKEAMSQLAAEGISQPSYKRFFAGLLENGTFVALTFIPGIFMYLLLAVYSNPFSYFIAARILQSIFVIAGVATLVFTILYLSPFDPARNILGVGATQEQVDNFNRLYGLDQSYVQQLWHSLSGLFTFDLGTSFAGKEDVAQSIMNKFPVTLEIAFISLLMAIVIAIPIGIISAIRPNSFIDYTFMIIALIGLSIPSFWQGLIMILTFSIDLKWFPATYNPNNWLSLVMPIIVLGTSLTASIARMTRSSMLEVIHEDYITTAKAKGLSERKVITKHAIRNAMIPIITVIGLLFGGMLGGASVTEKVFNISGIGSYIVDKQFIPDIPAILGGVVYIAVTISLVNMIIDILYNFFDPRIRSKMKKS